MSCEANMPTIPGLGFPPKIDPEKEICFATFDQNKTILLENQEKVGKCRPVSEFEKITKLGSGSFGIVYQARDTKSGEIVAMKKLLMDKEKEGLSKCYLREISILQKLKHHNIVNLKEIVVGKTLESIFLVMEYCEQDLQTVIENMDTPFNESQVKCLMMQLLGGLSYLHRNFVMHRDLTMTNLLLTKKGCLKIADFGLARKYTYPVKPMSPVVITLWYRAPEVLLMAETYTAAVDMWSVGCIFAELLLNKPLFPGKGDIHQLELIFNLLTTPTEAVWPGFSELAVSKNFTFTPQLVNRVKETFPNLVPQGTELLSSFFIYDTNKRITATAALKSAYFQIMPRACLPDQLPSVSNLGETKKDNVGVPGLDPV